MDNILFFKAQSILEKNISTKRQQCCHLQCYQVDQYSAENDNIVIEIRIYANKCIFLWLGNYNKHELLFIRKKCKIVYNIKYGKHHILQLELPFKNTSFSKL